MRNFTRLGVALLVILSVSGCRDYTWDTARKSAENKTYADRELNLTSKDYEKELAPKPMVQKSPRGDALSLASVVSEDQRDVLPQPLVSVTVNQDVSLRDIFYELAKQAQVDLELDPEITGSVIFTAYNRPFDQVVDRLSEIAGLRYEYKDGVLRVERDLPYMKIYRVDYLGLTRSFTSEVKASTAVDASAIGASGGGGGQNGSKSSITTNSASDFWKEVQANLGKILEVGRYAERQNNKTTPTTMPNAIPAVTTAQLATTGAVPPAQPAATTSIATTEKDEGLKSEGGLGDPYFSVNQQAGLISVFASTKQHKQVEEYFHQLRRSNSAQVLIEAKVLEVALTDEYAMGINWNQALSGDVVFNATLTNPNFISNPFTVPGGEDPGGQIFNLGVAGDDINVLLTALSRYGTTRTLSSPRLAVLNNQTALLNVSENSVFFNLDVTVQQSTTIGGEPMKTVNSEIKSVPEGIIINVQPSINLDTNDITLNLRPSVTKIVGQVKDPAVAFVEGDTGLVNNIPVVAVREMDSVVQLRSGETIVMGGLMQDTVQSSSTGIPVLSEIPFVGALFRGKQDESTKTELVVLIKATVVTPRPDATDRQLYKKFSGDRHPIAVD